MTIDEKIEYEREVTQADLFAYINENRYDMSDFTAKYFKSVFCERQMDSKYSIHQLQYDALLASYVFDEIECDKILDNEEPLPYDVVWWVGYITRKWVLDKKIKSRDIAEAFSFEDLASTYNGFHMLDDDMAVDRLQEIYHNRIKS